MAKNSNYKSEDRNPPPPPFGKKGQKKPAQTMEEQEADFKKAKKKLIRVAPLALIIIALSFYFVQKPVEPNFVLPQHTFAAFYDAERDLTRLVADGDIALASDFENGRLTIVYTPISGEYAIAEDAQGEMYKITMVSSVVGTARPSPEELPPVRDFSEWLAQVDDVTPDSVIITNADGTQILVQTPECSYILREDERPISIGGKGENYPIDFQENHIVMPNFGDHAVCAYRGDALFGLVYRNYNEGGHALYGIGEDGTSSRYGAIADHPYEMRSNKTSAYYVKNDTLYLMQNSASDIGTNELVTDVRGDSLGMSASRKLLYFINDNGELRKIKGKGTASLVAHDVAEVWTATDKGIYFITGSGELFSYNDRTARSIATGVTTFEVTYNMLTYYAFDGSVFIAPTGTRDAAGFTRVI